MEDPALRIGDVARLTGTTVRTIRYYEEKGLLPEGERRAGAHRTYGPDDVERLRELLRLRDLLGVSLEDLRELVETEDARSALRAELFGADAPPARRRELLRQADLLAERQLALVSHRRAQLDELEAELTARRTRIAGYLVGPDAALPF